MSDAIQRDLQFARTDIAELRRDLSRLRWMQLATFAINLLILIKLFIH